jgi:hypothetical protein
MKRVVMLMLGLVLAGAMNAGAFAKQACTLVMGTVRLEPDPACTIATLYPGPTYLGTCFKLNIEGLDATGSSGLTTETLGSALPNGGAAQSPVGFSESRFAAPQDTPLSRQILTARSVISMPGGSIYTADAIVTNGELATEQLAITKGDGIFSGATGSILVDGKALTSGAHFKGKICVPRR